MRRLISLVVPLAMVWAAGCSPNSTPDAGPPPYIPDAGPPPIPDSGTTPFDAGIPTGDSGPFDPVLTMAMASESCPDCTGSGSQCAACNMNQQYIYDISATVSNNGAPGIFQLIVTSSDVSSLLNPITTYGPMTLNTGQTIPLTNLEAVECSRLQDFSIQLQVQVAAGQVMTVGTFTPSFVPDSACNP